MTLTLDSDWVKAYRKSIVEPVVHARIEARVVTATINTISGDATLNTATTNLVVGMEVHGTGIPTGTTIQSKGSGTLEMSANATASATVTVTFKQVYNFLSGPNSAIDGEILISDVTAFSHKLDPYTRKLQTGTIALDCLDEGTIRRINGTYPLKGRDVRITLGTPELGEDEFAGYFRGLIEEIIPTETGITFKCADYAEVSDSIEFGGAYYCKHPLQVLKQLLEFAGVPAALIDTNSFDPDHADNDLIDHYTMTSLGLVYEYSQLIETYNDNPVVYENGPHRWQGAASTGGNKPGPENRIPVRKLIDDICFYMPGALFIDASGVFKFKVFNRNASAVRHFTTSDYADFEQIESQTHIINDLWIGLATSADDGRRMRISDTAAINEVGYWRKEEHAHVVTSEVRLMGPPGAGMQNPFTAPKSSGDAIAEQFQLCFRQISGFTGTWGTTEITAAGSTQGDLSFGGGSSSGRISASKYAVLNWRREMMKITGITMNEDTFAYYPQINDDGTVETTSIGESYGLDPDDSDNDDYFVTTYIPMTKGVGKITVTAGTRGFASTTPRGYTDAAWLAMVGQEGTVCHDCTVPYMWGQDYVMPRFAYGLPVVSIKTSLEHIDIEIGDVVTLDNDVFLWRHIDGLDNTSTMEVIGREVQPLGDRPHIKLTLALCKPASDPSSTITSTIIDNDLVMGSSPRGGFVASSGSNLPVASTPTGSETTKIAVVDRDLEVAAGRASLGNCSIGWRAPLWLQYCRKSKDTFVYIDPSTGAVFTEAVTTGAEDPGIPVEMAQLGKAVTGASSISSVLDHRRTGGIVASQLDRNSIETGSNLIGDSRFDLWLFDGFSAPVGWYLNTGTWGTDATRDSTQQKTGRYSVKMPNTSTEPALASNLMPVEHEEIYCVGSWVRGSTTGSNLIKITVEWYDKNRTFISRSDPVEQAVTTANTWQWVEGFLPAVSTAAFAKVVLKRKVSTADAWFQCPKFARAIPTFSAYLSANQSPSSQDRIDFDTEDHDHGDWFSTGGQKAAAPTAGVYCFNFSLKVEASTDAKVVSVLIRKNASAYNNGTELKTFVLGDIDAGSHVLWSYTFEALKLEAGDYVSAYITFSSGQPVIGGGAAESSFSGRRIN